LKQHADNYTKLKTAATDKVDIPTSTSELNWRYFHTEVDFTFY